MWNDMLALLKEAGIGSLATVCDGKPRNRPWGGPMEKDGKLYFCTGTFKEVCKQIRETPYVEFCSNFVNGKWVRIRGEVEFTDDLEAKTMVMDGAPGLRDVYHAPDDPSFGVFVMSHGEVIFGDFGRDVKLPPVTFEF
ncbi:MAG: pyridoxamine 5'-phosphate oxidase family protein [Lachnospiraceae bacterium]|jgi:uncharacterized pyridoxamine 5'-phosphate oxidase family protein|nr:pyridoxamine 5'-phosphate oxidase family protein [Lachnospiraceae bacterium]